jgi:hypothetical protein
MDIENMAGLYLNEAVELVEKQGLRWRKIEIKPIREKEPRGNLRVIRQKRVGDIIVLTVSHESYE